MDLEEAGFGATMGGLGCVGVILVIALNLALLAGGVWVVVQVLQYTGVL